MPIEEKQSNKTFRKIVGNVTVDNIRYIKNGNLDRAIDNKMVREIIFIYCKLSLKFIFYLL